MRSKTPYPCSGPSETALRISMSSVPCSSSICFLSMSHALLDALGIESTLPLLDCQGETVEWSQSVCFACRVGFLWSTREEVRIVFVSGRLIRCFQNQQLFIRGGPLKHVSNRYDNLSHLDFQRNHQLTGIFNLSKKFPPFVCPKRDETLTEVPECDSDAPAKNRRQARVEQLPCDHQAAGFRMQFQKQINFVRGSAIKQVPLRMR